MACATDGSACGGACDGSDAAACAFPADETECRAPSCADGLATVAASCDGAGACPAETTADCAPFLCSADACAADCVTHDDCAADHFCEAGVCMPTRDRGTACSEARSCITGFCVDGVCCDRACSAQCEACAEPGTVGTCAAATGAPRGGRAACASDGTTCAGACDGTLTDACAYPAADTACGERRCDSSMLINVGACDGAGACTDPAAILCEHSCVEGGCLVCLTDEHCPSGEVCTAGACTSSPTPHPVSCGCHVAARKPNNAPALATLVGLALAAVITARRRRARR